MAQHLNAAMWKQLLQRSARENMSLQGQIREMLVGAILDGQLPAGVPVPSSREMAEQLGVARNTVVLAYQQLADEGYLGVAPAQRPFRQRGHAGGAARRPRDGSRAQAQPERRAPDWAGALPASGPRGSAASSSRPTGRSTRYPFLYGQFDAALFPTCRLARVLHQGAERARHPRLGARPDHARRRHRWCSRSALGCCRAGACGRRPRRSSSPWARSMRSTWWPTC